MTELRTVRLLLAYDGSGFHGWQVQPGLVTVQQAVADAVAAATGEQVVVHGSGRTDQGVHAAGQVAHMQLSHTAWPAANLRPAINAHLPVSVRVMAAADAPAEFHARRSAVGKHYRYRMYRGAVLPPLLRHAAYHHPYPLDEAAMMAAAGEFVGEHDFRSFAAAPNRGAEAPRTTVRAITRSQLRRDGEELVYDVEGTGFLHHMVRNIAGYLLEIGRGTRRAGDLPEVLAARRRAAAGATAPPQGLCLMQVHYDPELEW